MAWPRPTIALGTWGHPNQATSPKADPPIGYSAEAPRLRSLDNQPAATRLCGSARLRANASYERRWRNPPFRVLGKYHDRIVRHGLASAIGDSAEDGGGRNHRVGEDDLHLPLRAVAKVGLVEGLYPREGPPSRSTPQRDPRCARSWGQRRHQSRTSHQTGLQGLWSCRAPRHQPVSRASVGASPDRTRLVPRPR